MPVEEGLKVIPFVVSSAFIAPRIFFMCAAGKITCKMAKEHKRGTLPIENLHS